MFGDGGILGTVKNLVNAHHIRPHFIFSFKEERGHPVGGGLGFSGVRPDGNDGAADIRHIQPRLDIENREISQVAAFDRFVTEGDHIPERTFQRGEAGGRSHDREDDRGHGKFFTRKFPHTERGGTPPGFVKVHVRIGLIAADKIKVPEHRFGDVSVQIKRGGKHGVLPHHRAQSGEEIAADIIGSHGAGRAVHGAENAVRSAALPDIVGHAGKKEPVNFRRDAPAGFAVERNAGNSLSAEGLHHLPHALRGAFERGDPRKKVRALGIAGVFKFRKIHHNGVESVTFLVQFANQNALFFHIGLLCFGNKSFFAV